MAIDLRLDTPLRDILLHVFVLDHAAARRSLQPSARLALLGAGAGCLMAAATYLVYPAFARLSPFIATHTARLYASFRALPPVIASLALLPVIIGEELVLAPAGA